MIAVLVSPLLRVSRCPVLTQSPRRRPTARKTNTAQVVRCARFDDVSELVTVTVPLGLDDTTHLLGLTAQSDKCSRRKSRTLARSRLARRSRLNLRKLHPPIAHGSLTRGLFHNSYRGRLLRDGPRRAGMSGCSSASPPGVAARPGQNGGKSDRNKAITSP